MMRSGSFQAVFALALAGCAAMDIPSTAVDGTGGAANEVDAPVQVIESKLRFERRYAIAPYDTLEIVVTRVPEMSRTVTVRPDGYISLPVVDEVKAAGLTPEELDAVLTERMAARLIHPEVSVIVTTFREPKVYVFGRVARPGPVPMKDAATAAAALALAGDALETGNLEFVTLIRIANDGKARAVVVGPIPPGQPGAYLRLAALPLEPEDILYVPEGDLSQFVRVSRDITSLFSFIGAAINPYFQIKILGSL